MKFLMLILLATSISGLAYGQTSSATDNSLRPRAAQSSFPSKKEIAKREKRAMKPKTNIDLQKEYYERVETVAKERRKAARIMQKPQYSDPMFFGHKRLPKKRAPKDMRFCKECGIRH